MTEDMIERIVERRFDSLDARLMRGELHQAEYDQLAKEIAQWADARYANQHREA